MSDSQISDSRKLFSFSSHDTFTATMATPRPNISLKARLAWKYFFEAGWAVVKTADNCYICTDESLDLSTATIFPDEDAFVSWLETVCTEYLNDDPVGFLACFVRIPELITEPVAAVIKLVIEKSS